MSFTAFVMKDDQLADRLRELQLAEQHGRLDVAAQGYEQILFEKPEFSPALFCLGMLRLQQGGIAKGRSLLEKAISVAPNEPGYRMVFSAALRDAGDAVSAIPHARKAFELLPDSVDAVQNLGACYFLAGQFEQAVSAARSEVALVPDSPVAHFNLGTTLACLSQLTEACESFEQVIRINPGHFDARIALVRGYLQLSRPSDAQRHSFQAIAINPAHPAAHFFHGVALRSQQNVEAAAASFQRCVELDPNLWDGFICLGEMTTLLRRWPDALRAYLAASDLRPGDATAFEGAIYALRHLQDWEQMSAVIENALKSEQLAVAALSTKASMLEDLGQLDSALVLARQALKLDPKSLKAMIVVSICLWEQMKFQESVDLLHEAIKLHPNSPTPRFNLGLRQLALGDEAGWANHEFRREIPGTLFPTPLTLNKVPRWDGSDLGGKTLLIYHEGGFGDFLQCLRALPQLASQAKQVVMIASPVVAGVIAKLPNVTVVSQLEQLPEIDLQIGDMSLPYLLQWSPTNPPAPHAYLAEPPDSLLQLWQQKLSHLKGFRIGIAWSGNREHFQHRRRMIPLKLFAPLATVNHVSLVSLQVGPDTSDLKLVDFPVFDASPDIATFTDTAAIIRQLDLVITVDTSVAHLAGAMGAPVWTLLAHVGDFRWLLNGDTSPWYPSMRLFRQKIMGDWQTVIEEVMQALKQMT